MRHISPVSTRVCIVTAIFLLIFTIASANATLLESVALLAPGSDYRVAFVTSGNRNATSADINDYDTFVQDSANSGSVTGGLNLTWSAIASTPSVAAMEHIAAPKTSISPITIFNTIGEVIASSYLDFWDGRLQNPIAYTENGARKNGDVWTGTTDSGFIGNVATLGAAGNPIYGLSSGTYSWWAYEGTNKSKSVDMALYGISNVLSASASPVPEPATLLLFGIGILGLAGMTRRHI